MSYQTIVFILFSVAAAALYYALGRKRQHWVLLAANILFLAVNGWKNLAFAGLTTVTSYFAALWINRVNEQAGAGPTDKATRAKFKKKKRRVLILCLIAVLCPLVVCKYTSFIASNIGCILEALRLGQMPKISLFLPLGISFYSFMAVSYVLDIYWKRYAVVRNFVRYAGYLTWFPHVVQGPIDRCSEFLGLTAEGIGFDYDTVIGGALLGLWGMFKKLVIADRLGVFVTGILDRWESVDGIYIVLAMMVYSIQIYADFSGCIDIVTGASEMFGIRLRENFNHPYFSRSMAEFWRRWHISLQEWFKDYVFYPVYTSRFSKNTIKKLKKRSAHRAELFSTCFPILVVWLVTGTWHGAAWTFIAWGLFHAALLIGSELCKPAFAWLNTKLRINTEGFGWKLWQIIRTFLLCSLGRVFFRAPNMTLALQWIKKIFTGWKWGGFFANTVTDFGLKGPGLNVAVISVLILLAVDMLQEKTEIRKTLMKDNLVFRWILILGLMFAVIIYGMYGPGFDAAAFIYEQF